MTTCKTMRQRISAYIDGELSEARAAEVRAHLSECEECAQYLDDMAGLGSLLDALPTAAASEDFTADVLARVRQRGTETTLQRVRRAVWRPTPRWAVAAALAAAIGLGSGLAWMTAPSAPQRLADAGAVSREFGLEAFDELPEQSIGGAYAQIALPPDGDGR